MKFAFIPQFYAIQKWLDLRPETTKFARNGKSYQVPDCPD